MRPAKLQSYIKTVLEGAAAGLVDGAKEDAELFFNELAADLVQAAAAADSSLLAITLARLQLIEERTRIRANDAALDVLTQVATAVFQIAKGVFLK